MSAPKAKPAATLKGLVALVGAAILYFVSQVLGIDLSGGKDAPGNGAGAPTEQAPAPKAPEQQAPTPKAPEPKAPAPKAPTPKAPEQQTPAPKAPEAKTPAPTKPEEKPVARRDDTKLIQQLFRTMVSDRIVEAEGEVVHILPLDNDGSRHQNFLVELSNGITLKVSHNIDLAPEIKELRKGDTIRFHGEYEYNEKGGVVHWTHRDPAGRHEHGWLEHKGKRYE